MSNPLSASIGDIDRVEGYLNLLAKCARLELRIGSVVVESFGSGGGWFCNFESTKLSSLVLRSCIDTGYAEIIARSL